MRISHPTYERGWLDECRISYPECKKKQYYNVKDQNITMLSISAKRSQMREIWRLCLSSSYLLAALGLTPLVAQTPATSGSYGFLVTVNALDTGDNNGGAAIGLMNIDDAGKVTGKFTIRTREL